jgi:hypothetical protein
MRPVKPLMLGSPLSSRLRLQVCVRRVANVIASRASLSEVSTRLRYILLAFHAIHEPAEARLVEPAELGDVVAYGDPAGGAHQLGLFLHAGGGLCRRGDRARRGSWAGANLREAGRSRRRS